jgi:pyridoxamine 5'-phosphate oxidase-like protein
MSRRAQIVMTDDEVRAFLNEERVMTCATLGPSGWPHLMPLWYVLRPPRDGESGGGGGGGGGGAGFRLWAWTFAKAQKVRNLERDPRATLQVEAGRDRYDQLRGVMLETEVAIHRDTPAVAELGLEIFGRYAGDASGQVGDEVGAMVRKQAEKRVGLEFTEVRRATWDHRKLGGVY